MPHGGPHGAGFSAPRKAPTRAEIERTYDQALDRFIKRNQDKKQQQSSAQSVIADMPEKFQKFIGRNLRDDGTMNSAAQAIFDFYDDGRTQYSRDINRISQKSPEFAAARARRFPIETFIERMAPVAVGAMTGLPLGLGTVYDEARKLGSATVGGLKDIAQKKGIIPRDDINPNTGTTSVKTDVINPAAASRIDPITFDSIFTGDTPMDPQPAVAPGTSFDPSAGRYSTGIGADDKVAQAYMDKAATFRSPRFTGRAPTDPGPVQQALPTDAITEGLKSLFTGETPTNRDFSGTQQQPFDPPMIPGGIPRGSLPIREGRLLGRDPNVDYGQELNLLDIIADDLNTRGEPQQTSSSDFLINQAKTLNAPGLNNEIQLAELNPSQRAVLDQRANRFAFDQGLTTPQDMLNKIRPLDRSGIFGFFGNEANVQDVIDFYRNNPTVTMAEGGLASINNPQYNMLMKASDFDI